MAELIASSLLKNVAAELVRPTGWDDRSNRRVRESETSQRNELDLLNSSIEDTDRRLEENETLEVWLRQMREVSELIEDVVDEYYALMVSQQWGFINYLSSRLRTGRVNIGDAIRNIEAILLEVKNRRGTVIVNQYKHRERRITFSKEEFLLGIAPAVGVLIRNYLVGGGPSDSAVAVLAADEISKNTLAEIYNNKTVSEHFDCRAWIVSLHRPYTEDFYRPNWDVLHLPYKGEILKSIAKGICTDHQLRDIDAMSANELVRTLRHCLRSKRYLLVFEDVREEEYWHLVKRFLPDDNSGSRIIITTHSVAVATACKEASFDDVNSTEPLSEGMAEDLFRKTTSQHDPRCPFELKQLSLEIIKKCEGFPLAIVAAAGLLLSKEKFPQEWRKLLENFCLEVEPSAHLRGLSEILALGFLDLPHQLKLCMLYFSIFSKESPIPNDKMFMLWIAEGFVQEKTGKTLEEVAQEYLDELTDRNLVQEYEGFYGIEKFCQVHHLMREILQKKADERRFCQIWGVKDSSFKGKSRRLLISNHNMENVLKNTEEYQVRSVFIRNIGALNNSDLVILFEKYQLLTLLDVENSPLEILPKEVGNLLCLKFLSLRNTKLKKLPKSIGKLHKLQTLDLTSTLLIELPTEIFKLQNLRHLLASRCDNKISLQSAKGVAIKAGIWHLVNLQTLMTIEAHLSGINVVQELKLLRQLRSLSISRLSAKLARALCGCIEVMSHLRSLRLHSMDNESLDVQTISSTPLHLERLVLKGLLQNFPDWISSLQNLSMLCLSLSRLADDPLHHFSSLPNLESLWLYRAYEGKKLHFPNGGFKKLKFLVLRELQGLEIVEIEEGALPLLEELRIGPSPLLNEVPSGIKHLRNLKVVTFYDMPNDFVLSMQPDGGTEYPKVEHVPSVLFWYRDEGRCYISYRLGKANLLDRLEGVNTQINDFVHHDSRLSFCYSDDEDDSASTSVAQWNDIPQLSFSSDRFSFFSDDIED